MGCTFQQNMVVPIRTFKAYDPGEALDVVRWRHSGIIDIRPLQRGDWYYTASSMDLAGIDIGRQTTSGFAGRAGRDGDSLRLIIVHGGQASSVVGSQVRRNDARECFGIIHPEASGIFTAGYAGIALRVPLGRVRSALAMMDCDIDPLGFADRNWGIDNLPGADLFQRILSAVLVTCEAAGGLMQIEDFRAAQAQLLTLHIADLISQTPDHPGKFDACSTAALGACIEFIRAHSHTQFELADMARHAGISLRTAQSQFAAKLDTTISSYVRSHRLDRTRARLLKEGDASVTSVALEEGFTHLGEFSRWYARRFGEKPSETLRIGRMRRPA